MLRTALATALLAATLPALALESADIAITDVTIDNECRAVLTLRNAGSTPLPASAYDQYAGAAIQFWLGTPADDWGGKKLSVSDAQRALVPANGSVQVTSLKKVVGTMHIGATIKPNDAYTDTNAANNSLGKTLTCNSGVADLSIVAVEFDGSCKPVVTWRNSGTGPLPDNSYVGANIYAQRHVDGAPGGQVFLKVVDKQKVLQPAGGQFAIHDTLETRPKSTLAYALKGLPDGNNPANDRMEVQVPDGCKPGAAKTPATRITAPAKVPATQAPAKAITPPR